MSHVRTPIINVEIIKPSGKPGVDLIGGTRYSPEAISCSMSKGFDQGSATCTLEIKTPVVNGVYIIFEPMNSVRVQQGWDKTSSLRTTFYGFIDKVEMSNAPQRMVLECRDILKLAENNYFINSNRKVYSAEVEEDEPDPNNPGGYLGGQSTEDRQAQVIITDLLTESGIPESRLVLDFVEYPDEGAIIIGNNAKAVFCYESALDAVNRICDLLGYRIWADENGCVQCREVRPIASETAFTTYRSQAETLNANGTFTVTTSGTLMSVESNVDDDLRNWIEVISSADENITATVAGPSYYITSPPDYRRSEIRSFLLDTYELAIAVANRVYQDLNRLRYTARVTIEGDQGMTIGRTVEIYDPYATQSFIKYFVYSYSSEFSSGNWVMDLELVGGSGPGSPPVSNVAPIPTFTWRVEREDVTGASLTEVFVDATDSYDPDGATEDLTYAWYCEGYSAATGVTNHYVVTNGSLSLVVTLTVTDAGTPPLSGSITVTIPLTANAGLVETRIIYAAIGTAVYISYDGGKSWIPTELY